jgi:hypothetical protein
MHVFRRISEPIRDDQSWDTRWEGPDRGLITSWEAGREMAATKPDDAALAVAGELLVLPWKGGVDKKAKTIPKKKIGSLNYVAMWQGLRGDDLSVDTAQDVVMTCTATGTVVTYCLDVLQHANEMDEDEDEDKEPVDVETPVK